MAGHTQLPRRACALQDRYPIASRNLGFPLSITLVATYPPSSAPPYDRLAGRIAELQRHLDLLWVRVCDAQTTKPYFEQRSRPWLPDEVLSDNVPLIQLAV